MSDSRTKKGRNRTSHFGLKTLIMKLFLHKVKRITECVRNCRQRLELEVILALFNTRNVRDMAAELIRNLLLCHAALQTYFPHPRRDPFAG